MELGVKLGAGLAAFVLAGSALSYGSVAGASQPPPQPGQDQSAQAQPDPMDEEGHGPGAIIVGPEGAARAEARLQARANQQAPRYCNGTVLPANGLNVRTGPGTGYRVVGALGHGAHVTTDWNSIVRRDGYLWVRIRNSSHWIADYKLGNGNGKWYVRYSNC